MVDGAWLAKGLLAISSSYIPGGGVMKASWAVCHVNILVADSVVGIRDGDEGDGERLRKPGVGKVVCRSRDRRDCFPFSEWGMSISDTVKKVVYIAWVRRSPVETGWEETKRNNERQAPEHLDTRSFGQSGPAVVGHL